MKFEAKIKAIIKRTYNIKSFRFNKPASFNYKPGQFMCITLKHGIQKMSKHFTILRSPTEDYLEFTKKLTGHPFSNALDELKEENSLEINGPFGFFTFEGEAQKVGMLTGGIGITPIRSMCRFCTDQKKKQTSSFFTATALSKTLPFSKNLRICSKRTKT
ncbi:MAG: FAD-dependent oxidoreductase [Candidatus Aminicenantales bacterium]